MNAGKQSTLADFWSQMEALTAATTKAATEEPPTSSEAGKQDPNKAPATTGEHAAKIESEVAAVLGSNAVDQSPENKEPKAVEGQNPVTGDDPPQEGKPATDPTDPATSSRMSVSDTKAADWSLDKIKQAGDAMLAQIASFTTASAEKNAKETPVASTNNAAAATKTDTTNKTAATTTTAAAEAAGTKVAEAAIEFERYKQNIVGAYVKAAHVTGARVCDFLDSLVKAADDEGGEGGGEGDEGGGGDPVAPAGGGDPAAAAGGGEALSVEDIAAALQEMLAAGVPPEALIELIQQLAGGGAGGAPAGAAAAPPAPPMPMDAGGGGMVATAAAGGTKTNATVAAADLMKAANLLVEKLSKTNVNKAA